jgi:hypothetical protein
MKISLEIEFINGDKSKTEAMFADFVAFERQWQRSVVKFEQEMRLTDLAWLGWKSEARQKRTPLTFDDWLLTVVSVMPVEEQGENPLDSEAPTAK